MFEQSRQGAVDLIHARDAITGASHEALTKLIDSCLRQGQPRVVIDLEATPLIDSLGLELLLDIQDRCARRGGALKLSAPNELCRDILKVTGIDARLEVHHDSASAAGSFAQ